MSSLTQHSEAEVRGDWNNLKGTDYHLVYALRMLLYEENSSISFYQGNDLLLRSAVPPPILTGADETLPIVSLGTCAGEIDTWIQLKATSAAWTPSSFFEENLLANFIYNAFRSQQQGKTWRVRLITQGRVRRAKLEEFIAAPENFSELNDKLQAVVLDVQRNLREAGFSEDSTNETSIKSITLSVLSQLSQTTPTRLETLRTEVELKLAYAYPDPRTVKQTAQTLLGAMLTDSAAGPSTARAYDAAWLNEAAGMPILRRGSLDDDPVAACANAVRRVAPKDWNDAYYAERRGLKSALQNFTAAPETLFVLLGAGGSGMSWAMARWSLEDLDGSVRLLIPGSDLDHQRTLAALVAERLQSQTLAAWTPEQFLQRLIAAAVTEGSGIGASGGPHSPHMLFIVDDLCVPALGVDVFRRDLARLVQHCRSIGAKLILTCRAELWNSHGLGADIDQRELFSPEVELGEARKTYSFVLGDFTADEQEDVLCRRFGEARGRRAASRLRASGFTPLRNPYLLARYLEQHGVELVREHNKLPVVTVDSLLDARVQNVLERAALSLELGVEDLQPAVDSLVDDLWRVRPQGLTRIQVISCFIPHLQTQSAAALNALRHQGLLTTDVRIQFAEQRILERLFAKRLGARMRLKNAEAVLNELRLNDDAGVVAAFLRGVAEDPVTWAETFMRHNAGWSVAITDGLAQCDPDDYRVLAFLFTLSRSKSVGDADPFAALGKLAARGERAWKWAVEKYLAPEASSKRLGVRLIAPAMEFVPHKVEAAIRRRLSRVAFINDFSIFDREKKKQKIMDGALDALRLINHRAAADVARRIIRRHSPLIGTDDEDGYESRDYLFEEDLDFARGRAALFGEDTEIENLCSELSAEDDLTRYRAAWAMLPIAKERPESVFVVLCEAIRRETHTAVLNRLLVAAYHLIRTYPDELLAALGDISVVRWDAYSPCAGQILMLLGNLAGERPQQVQRLLPAPPLQAYEGWARAFLSELLAYAWWRCAEHVADARAPLGLLANPDLAGVEEEFRPFAWRGAAIAQLALISLDQLPAAELTGRQIFYTHWHRRFLFVDAADFVRRHAEAILGNARYKRFEKLLLRCLHEQERVQIHVQKQSLLQARYACASVSLDMLIEAAHAMSDPLPLLGALPPDWQAVRAARRLLESGRTEPRVVEFAQRVGAEPTGTTSMNAAAERDLIRAQLARLEAEPRQALEQQRTNIGQPFLPNSGQVYALAELGDRNLDQLLALIDDSVRASEDLSTLYKFESEASSWQALLIARVYRRMFDGRPISTKEACELCEQMLVAVRGLPPSVYRSDYENLYGAIAAALDNSTPANVIISAPESVVQRSHALAASLLQYVGSVPSANEEVAGSVEGHDTSGSHAIPNLQNILADRRGWMDTDGYQLQDGVFSSGSNLYMIYFFPSVRLALCALRPITGESDVAAHFMQERIEIYELIKGYWHEFNHPDHSGEEAVERALNVLDTQVQRTPNDERLFYWRGVVLLHLRRLAEAEAALRRCIDMPSCDEGMRAYALYNLACVYALQRRVDECRDALQDAYRLNSFDTERTRSDPDFESVRGEQWFQAIVGNEELSEA